MGAAHRRRLRRAADDRAGRHRRDRPRARAHVMTGDRAPPVRHRRSPAARGRRVPKVPATTANLGPGFDTLGLALAALRRARGHRSRADPRRSTVEVTASARARCRPTSATSSCASIAHTFAAYGQQLPGLELVAHNRIPHGRGIGSSGAAIVVGHHGGEGPARGHRRDRRRRAARARDRARGAPRQRRARALRRSHDRLDDARGPAAQEAHRAPRRHAARARARARRCRRRSPAACSPSRCRTRTRSSTSRARRCSIAALIQSPELLLAATEDKLHQSYRAARCPRPTGSSGCCARPGLPRSSRVPVRRSSCSGATRRSGCGHRARRGLRRDRRGRPAAGRRLQGCDGSSANDSRRRRAIDGQRAVASLSHRHVAWRDERLGDDRLTTHPAGGALFASQLARAIPGNLLLSLSRVSAPSCAPASLVPAISSPESATLAQGKGTYPVTDGTDHADRGRTPPACPP